MAPKTSVRRDSYWHPDYEKAPKIVHPLNESILLCLLTCSAKFLIGLIFGLPFLFVLFIFVCCFVPSKFLYNLVANIGRRGNLCKFWNSSISNSGKHCDAFWPFRAVNESNLIVINVECSKNVKELRESLRNRVSRGNENFALSKSILLEKTFDFSQFEEIQNDSSAAQSASFEQLNIFLNNLARQISQEKGERNSPRIYLISNFGPSFCTLIIFQMNSELLDRSSDRGGVGCPIKFIQKLNDAGHYLNFYLGASCAVFPKYVQIIGRCARYTLLFCRYASILGSGLCELAGHCVRSRNAMWRQMIDAPMAHRFTKDEKFKGRRLSWVRVPFRNELSRIEQIVRCNTFELMVSFLAGALRRHFRANRIKHPTAIYATMQINLDVKCSSVSLDPEHHQSRACHVIVLPLKLATDIIGSVPRIWETQRRINDLVYSSQPLTYKMVSRLANVLPFWMSKQIHSMPNRNADGFVEFYETVNTITICNHKVFSLLSYASSCINYGNNFKFGCTFFRLNGEIVLSLVVDEDYFPQPDLLLEYFQLEALGNGDVTNFDGAISRRRLGGHCSGVGHEATSRRLARFQRVIGGDIKRRGGIFQAICGVVIDPFIVVKQAFDLITSLAIQIWSQ
uniref:Uncharacterized protein n=1 Tax=Romanomermis culicivorax TaxID=13658 RepID=A0A915IYW2_ROMCU